MRDMIKQALSRTISYKSPRGKEQVIVIPPNPKLVLLVKFSLGMSVCLSVLEIAHLIVLRSWNSEIFSGIMLIVGNILGIFLGHKGS
jgi:hypothetical protein